MAFPFVLVAISGFVSMTASRVISVVAGRKLAEKSSKRIKNVVPSKQPSSSLVKQNHSARQAEAEYLKGKAERENELVNIQADIADIREKEFKAYTIVASAQADRENRTIDLQEQRLQFDIKMGERTLNVSEKALKLKREELRLAVARLHQQEQLADSQREQAQYFLNIKQRELEILEEELREKRKLSLIYLDLIREQQSTEIELKLTEIQSDWDRENWAGILSRDETRQILIHGQQNHRLVMLVSPPDIEDCPVFNSNLQKEVRNELKEFMQRNYPLDDELCPVEFYGKFFKSSVFDAEVKQLERDLEPIPTIVIYSDITDQKIYFHVNFSGLQEPMPLTLPSWNWESERQKLVEEGKSEEESIQVVRSAITKIHQLLAAFLVDLYYLNINPTHEPRVFQLEESELPAEWVQTHFSQLRQLQADRREELERPARFKR